MPTKLLKPVSRETTEEYRSNKGMRPLVISLIPGGVIRFRFKGLQQDYDLPVGVAIVKAQALEAGGVETAPRKKRTNL